MQAWRPKFDPQHSRQKGRVVDPVTIPGIGEGVEAVKSLELTGQAASLQDSVNDKVGPDSWLSR